jgi:VWFA-related protein
MPSRMIPTAHRAFRITSLLTILVLAATAAYLYAQSAPPQTTPAAHSMTLQTSAPLVVLDVVVLDNSGNPVHDLKAADFTVTEHGKSVKVGSFEEHRADQHPTAVAPTPMPHLPPNVYTNYTAMPAGKGPLNVLLLDALNTQQENQLYVRQQMLKYVANLPPTSNIAVFGLTDRLMMLQGFTSNPALLKAAIEKGNNLPQTGPLLPSAQEAAFDSSLLNATNDLAVTYQLADSSSNSTAAQQVATLQQFQADVVTEQVRERMATSVAAMNELARYLSGLPGRKNLIWFSGSFPLAIMPDTNQIDPFRADAYFDDDIKATASLLARAQVAVYPVDARGIFTDPQKAVQNDNSNALFTPTAGAALNPAASGVNPRSYSSNAAISRNQEFFATTDQEHSTMDLIADQTGGKSFYKTNDLKHALDEAIGNGSNYYTITWVPDDHDWNGGFRPVKVQLDQKRVRLYYRPGYYAEDPNVVLRRADKSVPFTPLQVAMLPGGPDPMQIVFTVGVDATTATEDTPLASNHVTPALAKAPYRRFTVHYALDIHNLTLKTAPDGKSVAQIEIGAVVYNSAGKPVNTNTVRYPLALTPQQLVEVQHTGLRLNQQIDVPATGVYFLRLGLRDMTNDHVGAIEIPTAQVQLKPPAPPPTASAPLPAPPAQK